MQSLLYTYADDHPPAWAFPQPERILYPNAQGVQPGRHPLDLVCVQVARPQQEARRGRSCEFARGSAGVARKSEDPQADRVTMLDLLDDLVWMLHWSVERGVKSGLSENNMTDVNTLQFRSDAANSRLR